MKKLVDSYSGKFAKDYDIGRKQHPRWWAETGAMADILLHLKPQTVFDGPFGTGRWNDLYEAAEVETVFGVDLSTDMLTLAKQKIPDDARVQYRLAPGSLFDLSELDLPKRPDLAICARFVNWVDLDDMAKALGEITNMKPTRVMVGCSAFPEGASSASVWLRGQRLALRNLRKKGAPPEKVHPHDALDRTMRRFGYTRESSYSIFADHIRRNTFNVFVRD